MADNNCRIRISLVAAPYINAEYQPADWRRDLPDIVAGYDRACIQQVDAANPGVTVNLSEYAGQIPKLLLVYNSSDSVDATLTVTFGGVPTDVPLKASKPPVMLGEFDGSTNLVLTTAAAKAKCLVIVLFD